MSVLSRLKPRAYQVAKNGARGRAGVKSLTWANVLGGSVSPSEPGRVGWLPRASLSWLLAARLAAAGGLGWPRADRALLAAPGRVGWPRRDRARRDRARPAGPPASLSWLLAARLAAAGGVGWPEPIGCSWRLLARWLVMRVNIEPPEGWGPTRVMITELQRLGYRVEEWRVAGRSVLVIT